MKEPTDGFRRSARAAAGGLIAASLAAVAVWAPASSAAPGPPSSFTARGSVEQVQVTGAAPGERLKLIDKAGETVAKDVAGPLGGALFRRVEPGGGYRVRQVGGERAQSARFRVLSQRSRPPSTAIYEQSLPAGGYGYATTRDGTKLAST